LRLRGQLTLVFAVFAAVPMLLAVWPLTRALSDALQAEYASRLEGAARAVEGELRRMGGLAESAARELARGPEVHGLSRERAQGLLDPGDAAGLASKWMAARGLAALAVTDARGVVVSSGHLPGRAGDADPEMRALLSGSPAGRAVPARVSRATPGGVEPHLVLLAWEAVPGDPGLRVAAGISLGPAFAERVAALAGGDVALRAAGDEPAVVAPEVEGGRLHRLVARLLGTPRARVRSIPVGAPGSAPLAHVEVTVPATGLEKAQETVAAVFLAILGASIVAALLIGHLAARLITRPLDALRGGAARLAAGDLDVRVRARATGEIGDLVVAFNAMTADLRASRERAAAAERVAAWQEVARRLAHEVKNPLTPIAMSVATLRDALAEGRPDFPALFEEGASAIQEEVRRLKRIVDEFSRFSRLPAPEPVEVAPAELVDALLALYPAPPPGVRLERAVEPGLPPVRVDRDQILQVLINLVRNGEEAMASAGGTLRVAARLDAGDVLLEVSDTGPGIPAEDLPRVLEPYFTTKAGGTGLGLAIAERIVRENGGRLEVRSTPGAGATFAVRIPASRASGPASP
jgi:signal transduction histidine kinase